MAEVVLSMGTGREVGGRPEARGRGVSGPSVQTLEARGRSRTPRAQPEACIFQMPHCHGPFLSLPCVCVGGGGREGEGRRRSGEGRRGERGGSEGERGEILEGNDISITF